MSFTSHKGFTLIELVMVIVLVGILGTVGSALLAPIVNLYFFTPNQTRIESIANLINDRIIEGDAGAKGLRIIKSISAATDTSITYTDVDLKSVTLSWNSVTGKFSRTTPAGTEILPKEYPNNDIVVNGQTAGIIFKYYTSAEALISTPVAAPSTIGRVQLNLVATTGTGIISSYGTKFLINSGVHIKQF
ncbi:MAG: type II secretion system protein [bacterium]